MPTCRALPKLYMHLQTCKSPTPHPHFYGLSPAAHLPQDPGRHVPPMLGGCPQGAAMTQLGSRRPRRHCGRPSVPPRQLPRISCFSPRPRGGSLSGLPPAGPCEGKQRALEGLGGIRIRPRGLPRSSTSSDGPCQGDGGATGEEAYLLVDGGDSAQACIVFGSPLLLTCRTHSGIPRALAADRP